MQEQDIAEQNEQLTLGKSDGPSKLLSIYRIKSRLSPLTSLLCSSDGTYFEYEQNEVP